LYKECFLQMRQSRNRVQSYTGFRRNHFYHFIVTVDDPANIGLPQGGEGAKDQYLQYDEAMNFPG